MVAYMSAAAAGAADANREPHLFKTKLCKLVNGAEARRSVVTALRVPSGLFLPRVISFTVGFWPICPRGGKCWFAHGQDELRKPFSMDELRKPFSMAYMLSNQDGLRTPFSMACMLSNQEIQNQQSLFLQNARLSAPAAPGPDIPPRCRWIG
ncbi:hypothetical protein T484DRAFT_1799087 [Baffinella frigidus]|nr:hypothetical protein T484DRAFT_1799087 [Cryptophyta sp. CCMP2293]